MKILRCLIVLWAVFGCLNGSSFGQKVRKDNVLTRACRAAVLENDGLWTRALSDNTIGYPINFLGLQEHLEIDPTIVKTGPVEFAPFEEPDFPVKGEYTFEVPCKIQLLIRRSGDNDFHVEEFTSNIDAKWRWEIGVDGLLGFDLAVEREMMNDPITHNGIPLPITGEMLLSDELKAFREDVEAKLLAALKALLLQFEIKIQ